ncbi:hypothetical protein [Streptomyces sp. CC228A]|uniref:hypothetical protein n=1 Tax=Streptomyces sp. CC228A TaxID=2898186 RepID=UPI001F29C4F6|nr:hypothetical protein [Streptomyces sp. CC228A]
MPEIPEPAETDEPVVIESDTQLAEQPDEDEDQSSSTAARSGRHTLPVGAAKLSAHAVLTA